MKVKRSVHSQSSLSESTQMCFLKSSTHMFRSNRTPSRCPGGIQRPPTKLHKWAGPACEQGALALFFRSAADVAYSGETSAGPEHVQNSTPETWSHPHTHSLGGMFYNARVTHTARLCTKNTGAEKQQCWHKKAVLEVLGKKVCGGHASHTFAHCFQEMSTCIIADR